MKILLATNNSAKVARIRRVLADRPIEILTPKDLEIPSKDVEEGSDLQENAERKARAYVGLTDLPILGQDSAFVIPDEDLDPSKVKRNALDGRNEADLSQEDIARAMIAFYQKIVERRGGPVPAYWEDVWALVMPDGTVRHDRDQRPVRLTAEVREPLDIHFPLRSMYIVEATGKYGTEHTPQEEALELKPYEAALARLLELK